MATVAKRLPISSANGILALLDNEDDRVRAKALQLLYPVVDTFWAEIAQKVDTIEALSELENFEFCELAAAVAAAAAAGSHPRVEVVTFDPSGGVSDRLPLRLDLRPALACSHGAALPDVRAAPEGRPVAISWADSSSSVPLHTGLEPGGCSIASGENSSASRGVWALGLVVASRCRIAAFELAPGAGAAGRPFRRAAASGA